MEDQNQDATNNWIIVVTDKREIKKTKTALETRGLYDKTRLITQIENGSYTIPVISDAYRTLVLRKGNDETLVHPFQHCQLKVSDLCSLSKIWHKSDTLQALRTALKTLAAEKGFTYDEMETLVSCSPKTWSRHGDLVIMPQSSFSQPVWDILVKDIKTWQAIASVLKCSRIALHGKVNKDRYRTPLINLVFGDSGWVTHTDNGVQYVFDVTKCMFSQGNITEKMRMAQLQCNGEVIVDLFAGIGYFTLPLLVHTGAKLVHACEWNPAAVQALRRGLVANNVVDKCIIHEGDNKLVAPKGVADRVLLGLIPSSEDSWNVACCCLRPDKGGWIHVHGNVSTKSDLETHGETFDSSSNSCTVDSKRTPMDYRHEEMFDSLSNSCTVDSKRTPMDYRHGETFDSLSNSCTVDSKRTSMDYRHEETFDSSSNSCTVDSKSYERTPMDYTDTYFSGEEVSCGAHYQVLKGTRKPEYNKRTDFSYNDDIKTMQITAKETLIKKKSNVEKGGKRVKLNCSTRNEAWSVWAEYVANSISTLLCNSLHSETAMEDRSDIDQNWVVTIQHIEHVKSYAPHIHHIVVDLECRLLQNISMNN